MSTGTAGSGGSTVGDCRMPDSGCTPPYVCGETEAGAEDYGCRDPRPAPTCAAAPPGQVVPFVTVSPGLIAHWTVDGGCVRVSHDASTADLRVRLEQALVAWSAVTCSKLCLNGISQEESVPDLARRERRIHVRTAPVGAMFPPDAVSFAALSFDPKSGRIISVTIDMTSNAIAREGMTVDDFLAILGQGFGLGRPAGGADSVLGSSYAPGVNVYDQPTSADGEALCRLYGDPPLCGE